MITFVSETGAVLCNIKVNDITKLRQSTGFLRVYVNKTRTIFAFPGWRRVMMGGLGAAGLGVAYSAEKNSGILNWVAALRQARPDLNLASSSIMSKFKWTFIIIFGLLALIAIGVAVSNVIH